MEAPRQSTQTATSKTEGPALGRFFVETGPLVRGRSSGPMVEVIKPLVGCAASPLRRGLQTDTVTDWNHRPPLTLRHRASAALRAISRRSCGVS